MYLCGQVVLHSPAYIHVPTSCFSINAHVPTLVQGYHSELLFVHQV